MRIGTSRLYCWLVEFAERRFGSIVDVVCRSPERREFVVWPLCRKRQLKNREESPNNTKESQNNTKESPNNTEEALNDTKESPNDTEKALNDYGGTRKEREGIAAQHTSSAV